MTQLIPIASSVDAGDVRCERVVADSPLAPWISVDPHRMHGEPCFKGTRVLVQTLFDYLRGGDSIAEFLAGFPEVSLDQAEAVIDFSAMALIDELRRL